MKFFKKSSGKLPSTFWIPLGSQLAQHQHLEMTKTESLRDRIQMGSPHYDGVVNSLFTELQ